MRVLLDTCVWRGGKDVLAAEGHDVEWLGDDEDPGDEEITQRASVTGAVLVTLDKDFGELAILRGIPHAGIVRLVGLAARRQGNFAAAALARYELELARGAIVTVYADRVLFRPGESERNASDA